MHECPWLLAQGVHRSHTTHSEDTDSSCVQPGEHEVDEALLEDGRPIDGAELDALSEHDGHDGPKLISCENRRATEHLQVSRARLCSQMSR